LEIESLLGRKKMFWAGLLRSFRKEKPFAEGTPVVSKQTVEERKGIYNSDFLGKIYLCLKSSSLSENRHNRKNLKHSQNSIHMSFLSVMPEILNPASSAFKRFPPCLNPEKLL